MHSIYAELKQRAEELERLKGLLEARLKKAPKGTLRISNKNGNLQFYYRESRSDRCGKYLNAGNEELIARLAQKSNDEQELKAIMTELEAINRYLAMYPKVSLEEVYGKLHPAKRELVKPSVETEEMFLERWKKKYHTDESFSRGRPEFKTDRGEYVRSKSEVLIANTINRLDRCYVYEPAVILPGMGTVHPDFLAPNPRKRITVFIEHLGMMGEQEYADMAVPQVNC